MGEEQTKTLWLGNLDDRVQRRHLYEIGIQAGPVASISLPALADASSAGGADAEPRIHRGFGFVQYETVESAAYAVQLFRGNLSLFGRQVRVEFGGQTASRGAAPARTPASAGNGAAQGGGTPAAASAWQPEQRQQQHAEPGATPPPGAAQAQAQTYASMMFQQRQQTAQQAAAAAAAGGFGMGGAAAGYPQYHQYAYPQQQSQQPQQQRPPW